MELAAHATVGPPEPADEGEDEGSDRGPFGWGVTLKRGTYSFGSDRTGLKRTLRVR